MPALASLALARRARPAAVLTSSTFRDETPGDDGVLLGKVQLGPLLLVAHQQEWRPVHRLGRLKLDGNIDEISAEQGLENLHVLRHKLDLMLHDDQLSGTVHESEASLLNGSDVVLS